MGLEARQHSQKELVRLPNVEQLHAVKVPVPAPALLPQESSSRPRSRQCNGITMIYAGSFAKATARPKPKLRTFSDSSCKQLHKIPKSCNYQRRRGYVKQLQKELDRIEGWQKEQAELVAKLMAQQKTKRLAPH